MMLHLPARTVVTTKNRKTQKRAKEHKIRYNEMNVDFMQKLTFL